MTFAYQTTRWTLDLAKMLIKADIRLHNLDVLKPDMGIIFAANHFTRIETFLLPYELTKHTGHEVWSLAASDLFKGRIGGFLRAVGTVSTKDPDRDKIIIRSLLNGEHPWVIFPEGSMIKDKKLVDESGAFRIYHRGRRRRPFTGAAALALQAELYRMMLKRLAERGDDAALRQALDRVGIPSHEAVASRRTVIIPVNITYFPIRSQENGFLNLAKAISEKISARAIEELSVEGTILAGGTDIDITLGQPIEIRPYLERPEFHELMTHDHPELMDLDARHSPVLTQTVRDLMSRYMTSIYKLTTINFDHIFSTLIRHQKARHFTERAYRNRIYLCARSIADLNEYRMHGILRENFRDIINEDPSPKFDNFMRLCLKEKIIRRKGPFFVSTPGIKPGRSGFHEVRRRELAYVIANEIEPLHDVTAIIERIARMPRAKLSRAIRELFVKEDRELFEKDYADHFKKGESKPPEIGRPFLLLPRRVRAGIVLVHGYLAAPMEVRAMAEYFRSRDYAVYGVRLKGHGTSPEDLAGTSWEAWYESLNRGYAIIKSLTDNIILGGFSTGGGLALLGAGRKGVKIRAAFAINPPLHLRDYSVHLVPTMAVVSDFLGRISGRRPNWEYLKTLPENAHINYHRHPVGAIKELGKCIEAMEEALPNIKVPTLILQASKDPIVDPVSGQLIFSRVGSPKKELTCLERSRHGIINGDGAAHVFSRIRQFLDWALRQPKPPDGPSD